MRKIFRCFLFLASIIVLASCSATRQATADKQTLTWRYEIEPTSGQATQGSILVKVWSYSKDKNIAQSQAGKNAVHGVLFKGVAALNDGASRIPAQRPIVTDPNAENTHADFFKTFFADGGKYMKYVNFVNNGIPAAGDIIKIRNEYKIGIKVSVSKDALRKEMEADGIIQSLSSGF